MKPSRNATYVYCLVAAPSRPRLTRVPRGLPGTGPVRLLDLAPGRYLVVADAPVSRYGEGAVRRGLSRLEWVSRAAMAHEAVVESFGAMPAVLPMKLFTLFTSDERALAHLRRDLARVESLVKRVQYHQEWGVRVALGPVAPAARPKPVGVSATRGDGSGLAYLTGKKAQRDAAVERATRARDVVAGLYDRLAGRSRQAKRRAGEEVPVAGGPLLLDAMFLVSRRRSRSFTALVARESRALARHGYDLTVTGPWPPYSFV